MHTSTWIGILHTSENFSFMEVKRLAPPAAPVYCNLPINFLYAQTIWDSFGILLNFWGRSKTCKEHLK